jgi:hypothetical protein
MAVVSSSCFSEGDGDACQESARGMYASYVDHEIRQAVQFCWNALPKTRRTPQELQSQMQRVLDRALRDFQADIEEFSKA